MGERDDALRTIADARTRLSALADELGRRAAPEHVKEVVRELATGKADELKHRAREMARDKIHEMKHHAKEVAMRRTSEWRHEAMETPRGMGLLGALVGAGLGSTLAKRFFESRHRGAEYRGAEYRGAEYRGAEYRGEYRGDWREGERDWSSERSGLRYGSDEQGVYDTRTGYYEREPGSAWSQKQESEGPGMGERAGAMAQSAKEKAGETVQGVKEKAGEAVQGVKERASEMMGSARERASGMRERIPSRYELRDQARGWYSRAMEEQPVALALGAFAFGALAAALLPVTSQERRVLEPARRKAEEAVSQVGGRIEERIGASGSQQESQASGEGTGASSTGAYGTGISGTGISGTGSSQTTGAAWSSGRMDASGSREWNDRREVHTPEMGAASTSGPTIASTDASTPPLAPLPSADDLGKVH